MSNPVCKSITWLTKAGYVKYTYYIARKTTFTGNKEPGNKDVSREQGDLEVLSLKEYHTQLC